MDDAIMCGTILPVHRFFVIPHGDYTHQPMLNRAIRNWFGDLPNPYPEEFDWGTRNVLQDDLELRSAGVEVKLSSTSIKIIDEFKNIWVRQFIPVTEYVITYQKLNFTPVCLYINKLEDAISIFATWCYQHAQYPWSIYSDQRFYLHPKDFMLAKLSFDQLPDSEIVIN